MRYDKSWEDLGSRIREEVDRAVNSQDFQNMAKNIRQTVETVVDLGGETVRRASKSAQPRQTVVRPPSVAHLYGATGGRVVGGSVCTVEGTVEDASVWEGWVFSGGCWFRLDSRKISTATTATSKNPEIPASRSVSFFRCFSV